SAAGPAQGRRPARVPAPRAWGWRRPAVAGRHRSGLSSVSPWLSASVEESRSATAALETTELLHHLAHLVVLFDELVDLRKDGPGASRDAPPAGGVEDRGIAPLARRHRPDDRFGASQVAPVDGRLRFLGHAAEARDHADDLTERTHLLDLLHRVEHVLEGEARLLELLLHLG